MHGLESNGLGKLCISIKHTFHSIGPHPLGRILDWSDQVQLVSEQRILFASPKL